MPDPIQVTVCVVALTQNDRADIEPIDFSDQVTAAAEHYNFAAAGKPYGPDPDGWTPFSDGHKILDYFRDAQIKPSSVSEFLYDETKSADARDQTELFVIDPLVLMHRTKRDILTRELQTTIRTGKRSFCIILPATLPAELRAQLMLARDQKLRDLKGFYLQIDVCEWEAETPGRLQDFLHRFVRSRTSDGPDPTVLKLVAAILTARGAQTSTLGSSPRMISGP